MPADYCLLHEDALIGAESPSALPENLTNLNDLLRRNASGVIIR